MILFFSDGRLGNELFQYTFLASLAKAEEKIIFCNGQDLQNTFVLNDPRCVFVTSRVVNAVIRRIIALRIFDFLCRARLISCIYQKRRLAHGGWTVAESEYRMIRGVLRRIRYVAPGFFQSEKFFNPAVVENIHQRGEVLEKARQYVMQKRVEAEADHTVFVHVRRGDYLCEAQFGFQDMSLPKGYYSACIEWFVKRYERPLFVFLTDDSEYVKEHFSWVRNVAISEHGAAVDFAIMTLCDSGVLSNSSFAWWASYLMHRRDVVVCPRYWLGFKARIQHPEGICPSFTIVVDPLDPQMR